jgi:hypothetical protein
LPRCHVDPFLNSIIHNVCLLIQPRSLMESVRDFTQQHRSAGAHGHRGISWLVGSSRTSESLIRDEIDRFRNVTITPSVDRLESAVRPVHNARTNNQPCNSGAVAKPRSLLTSTTSSNISSLENFEGAEWQRRIHLQTQCLGSNVPTMAQS